MLDIYKICYPPLREYLYSPVSTRWGITHSQLENYCKAHGDYSEYGEQFYVQIKNTSANRADSNSSLISAARSHIYCGGVGTLSDVRLVGHPPLAVHNGQYIEIPTSNANIQLASILGALENPRALLSQIQSSEKDNLIEQGVLLHHGWAGSYFHWVADTLPLLEGLAHYIEQTGETPKLLVGPEMESFHWEWLDLLGYTKEDVIVLDTPPYTVETLVIPKYRRSTKQHGVAVFPQQWLREQTQSHVDRAVRDSDFSNRVYISRCDAETRNVVNETAVMDVLSRYGFEKYILSELELLESIALFAQAESIVSPHSGGLANLMFTENATLIELFPETINDRIYAALANQHDIQYEHIQCQSIGMNQHFKVNLAKLEEIFLQLQETIE
jgi:capsular polysaccharide biosynthesis protein